MRNWIVKFALITFGLLLPLVICELAYRVEPWIRKGTPLLQNPNYRWDTKYGWTGTEHRLGNPDSDRLILVLGDSFTEGLGVASEQMWFSLLASSIPDARLIAYGALGWGTLQQLMKLEEYLKNERPEVVVLQLCSNDLINNYRPLEEKSYLQRAPGPRPYLTNEAIALNFPRKYDHILFPIISYSRLAYRYNNRLDEKLAVWARERKIRSIEFDIQERGSAVPEFKEAVAITEKLLALIKARIGEAELLLMLVDDLEPYTTEFRKIAAKLAIPIVVPPRINPFAPEERLPDGTHLNPAGNRKLGETFLMMARKKEAWP